MPDRSGDNSSRSTHPLSPLTPFDVFGGGNAPGHNVVVRPCQGSGSGRPYRMSILAEDGASRAACSWARREAGVTKSYDPATESPKLAVRRLPGRWKVAVRVLVFRFGSHVNAETVEAPGQRGARRENTGGI